MKKKIRTMLSFGAFLLASLATGIVKNGMGNTCVFLAYQPDYPEELRE